MSKQLKVTPPPKRTRGAPKFTPAVAPPSHSASSIAGPSDGCGQAVFSPPAGGEPARLPGSGLEVIVDPYGGCSEPPARCISLVVSGDSHLDGLDPTDRANVRLLLGRTDRRDLADLIRAARNVGVAVLIRTDLPDVP